MTRNALLPHADISAWDTVFRSEDFDSCIDEMKSPTREIPDGVLICIAQKGAAYAVGFRSEGRTYLASRSPGGYHRGGYQWAFDWFQRRSAVELIPLACEHGVGRHQLVRVLMECLQETQYFKIWPKRAIELADRIDASLKATPGKFPDVREMNDLLRAITLGKYDFITSALSMILCVMESPDQMKTFLMSATRDLESLYAGKSKELVTRIKSSITMMDLIRPFAEPVE